MLGSHFLSHGWSFSLLLIILFNCVSHSISNSWRLFFSFIVVSTWIPFPLSLSLAFVIGFLVDELDPPSWKLIPFYCCNFDKSTPIFGVVVVVEEVVIISFISTEVRIWVEIILPIILWWANSLFSPLWHIRNEMWSISWEIKDQIKNFWQLTLKEQFHRRHHWGNLFLGNWICRCKIKLQ